MAEEKKQTTHKAAAPKLEKVLAAGLKPRETVADGAWPEQRQTEPQNTDHNTADYAKAVESEGGEA